MVQSHSNIMISTSLKLNKKFYIYVNVLKKNVYQKTFTAYYLFIHQYNSNRLSIYNYFLKIKQLFSLLT